MKSLFKSLMLVAVAAMGFTACQKGSDEVVVLDDVKMTINAAVESNRTVIDEANKRVNWSAGDALKVIENSTTYSTTSAINIATDGTAQFTVSFPANTATEFTYNAIYPASQVFEDENVDATRVKVLVKDAQSATATSFDPLADILVSKHIETTAQPTTLDMQFKRLVALGKLTLTNLPASSTISKVTFTAGKEDVLAGRNYVNTVTGAVSEYGYHGKTNAISVSYDEAVASTTPIYFACNPFDMAEGEVFKVEVICSDATYTREVTIPAGRSLTFVEGDLNTFSVDMASATKEENFVFPDGEYVIISVNTAGTVYSAMTSVDSGASTKRFSSTTVEYDGVATVFTTDDETLIWNIKGIDGGYTIQDKDGKYLSWSSGNSAKVQGGSFTLDIVPVDNTAQYNVTCDGGARILAKNSSNPYFAFYPGSQDKNLFLVPVGEVTDPYFEVEGLKDSYKVGVEGDEMWFGDFNKFNGLTSTITASTDVDWITIEDRGEEFTITIAANSGAFRKGAITFSAEGAPDVTTTIKQVGTSSKITVADFLDLKDTTIEFELSGNITRVVDTSYGNFDLTDATGTVYVYGLLTPSGEKQKQWSAAGLKEGDYITIKGVYNVYNNSPQVKNAIYVSHSAISVDKSEISFEADGGSESVTVTLVNVEEQIEATCDNSHFQITKSGNTVTVTAPKNETEDYIVGVLTISAGPVKALINLSQLMPSTGDSEPTWTLVTDVTTLAEGDQIIIAAKNAAVAMSTTQNGNNRGQTAITKVDDNNILATPSSSVQILTLKAGINANTWAFYTGSGYLYAAGGTKNNYLRTQTTLSADGSWNISITSAGVATVKATGTAVRNWLRHNSQNSIFSCYGQGQNDIVIYKLQ